MRAHGIGILGRLSRRAALIGIGSSLIVITACGSSSTVAPRAHATATATATALPDSAQTPTTVVVGATPVADPSLCSPASTVAPLPATLTTLYSGTSDGTVTALNAADGSKRWSHPTGVSNLPHLVTSGTIVYASVGLQAANSPTTILALGAADGAVKWQTQIGGSPNYGGGLPLTVANGVVYAPGADGVLRALDGATGTELWHYAVGGGVAAVTVAGGTVYSQNYLDGGLVALRASDGALLWHFATEANSQMQPVVANGLVYAGETATRLVALNTDTGAVHWRAEVGIESFPIFLRSAVVAGTGLYVNASNKLYAFNASTGAVCWIAPANGQFASSVPLLDGDTLYETSFGGVPGPGSTAYCDVFAVDAHTGAQRWDFPAHGFVHVTPDSLVNGLLYVNATQAQALRPDTGAAAWRYPAQENQLNGVGLLVIGGTAYVGLEDGTLHALNAADGTPGWSTTVGGAVYSLAAGA
jgi:outer membrane protein assembly factor BamB